ncbi:EAL and HDOD domain-containing protein [Alkalimonas amylolytica]|uniref:EAL and modified HD-GYP domain-containing signal transduction protein n=1 Tax=Alkalimonas amylolytica TaxID=152573 RepID=A0A1H3Y4D4_ALKAM|nr:HDOD domain-containing protein [Alkalimonas amylolytica]SEA05704.1 EAL and modified HD-GYP domain-containing signal transduction protein [Alkalimonas amylolytica]
MYGFVARQPIFDKELQLLGYELLFRDDDHNRFPNIDPDEATSRLLSEQHLLYGLERITGNKLAFINFAEDSLLYQFPTALDPSKTVIEILESVHFSSELLTACRELHKQGYQLALDDFTFHSQWQRLMPYISYLKVDIRQNPMDGLAAKLAELKDFQGKFLAEKVETMAEFEQLQQLGFDYFQGYFFARPEMLKHKRLGHHQMHLLSLIAEAAEPELDFDKLVQIMERDLGLSYKLLRFINSAYYARSKPIQSLKHAMVFMGEVELKKFIALVALSNLAEHKQPELLKLSIIRARFCDLVAKAAGHTELQSSAFLTGMLSLIDALLEQPLDHVLSQLPLEECIKQALLQQQGPLGQPLKLILDYEQANWQRYEDVADQLLPAKTDIRALYLDALDWAEQLQL